MPLQGRLSVERMCQLAQVSRIGFYRWLQESPLIEEEMEVRSLIQQIWVEHRRRYGYRRVCAELRRRGVHINRKRVARLMREDNLLSVQPPGGLSQSCAARKADRGGPTVGGGHHLHQTEDGVCLPGGDPRCIFS